MQVLVVLDHPQGTSYSAAVAEQVRRGALAAGHSVELADLAAEGFRPEMTAADLEHFRGRGPLPQDVRREQARVDRADALVMVFPIYWWSTPARTKGWIDRVFTNGWAYVDGPNATIEGRLRDRPVELLAVGATDEAAYERHGYAQAMETQIPYGIFNYCGLTDVRLHRLLDSDLEDAGPRRRHLTAAYDLGLSLRTPALAPAGR